MARPKTKAKPAATAPRKAREEPPAPSNGGAAAFRRNVKTSEVVALDIVRDIVARKLQPGDKLPLESELLRQYRVSRSSLREALRLLEVQGLITIRPGPGGGTVVGKVQPASLARTLTLHMHLTGATYDELLDTWVLTEALLAEMAAKNPDREKVKKALSPFLIKKGRSDEHPHAIREGLEFHELIGDLAENRVLSFILMMAGTIITEHIVTNLDRQALEDHIVHDHAAVAEAIIAGNSKIAFQIMRDHIHHVAEYFRENWPRKVGEKIQWR
jgi:DNA-binding FadR family transcriptional regulator